MCKHDVIHKTGSKQRMSPDENQATAIGSIYKKIVEDRTCSSEHDRGQRD